MADQIIYLPNHGYSDKDPLYISWFNGIYYVSDKTTDSFKIVGTAAGSDYIPTREDSVTDGYVRKIDQTASTSIDGLEHLEGQSVYVTSGEFVYGPFVVSSGAISLSDNIYNYQVGLPYSMKIRTNRMSVPNALGTLQTRIKRIMGVAIRYLRMSGGKAGQEYDGREYLTDMEASFSTKAQDTDDLAKGGYSKEAYTVIKSDTPRPATVLAAIIDFEVTDK